MQQPNEEVNAEVERIELDPIEDGDDELVESESSTDEQATEDTEQEESDDSNKPDEVRGRQLNVEHTEPKPVEGETPRELALRKEVERLREKVRKDRGKELFGNEDPKPQPATAQPKSEILSKYDPKELENFEEVFDALAEKKGYVRKDEYQATTYQQVASDVLDSFLESHPEYLPENDKDNILWTRFQDEYTLYAKPQNPKDFKKIFDKVHREIYGIQPSSALKKVDAQREKIKVASHTGASPTTPAKRSTEQPELKEYRSHMKGFSDEELTELGL